MAMKLTAVTAGGVALAGCMMLSTVGAAPKLNALEAKVAADFRGKSGADVWHYAVPAMSEIQRLADVYPSDGVPDGTVKIVAAKDEYEPGSFLVWARNDLGKVQFELSEFKNETGVVFPKEKLDLKFIKVWYQNKNAWFSYFGDTGFKLCPELLLNDEDLIRVDTKKEANYAKLVDKDGKKIGERWINPPRQMDRGSRGAETFQCMREDFHDAATLQPVYLPRHEFRSFILTAHASKDVKPGLYKGEVVLKRVDGRRSSFNVKPLPAIPVAIRVLDFELPEPKCYFQPEKDFFVAAYTYISRGLVKQRNGDNDDIVRKQLLAIFRNQIAHNQKIHWVRGNFDAESVEMYDIIREAGMRTDFFLGGVYPPYGNTTEQHLEFARIVADEYDRRYGHHNVYIGYGDEPGAAWLAENRLLFEIYQNVGLKFIIAGWTVFPNAAYLYDWHNMANDATDGTVPALWAKMDNASHVGWYASPHVGTENPAMTRRQNGLGAYLSGYTALCNYAHHLGDYNDDSESYKPMVLAYGSYDGVIDTLAWEGFREGVDDIRYATLLTDLARKAQKSGDLKLRYLGGKAMQYLALLDPKSFDQDSARGEMIKFILALKDKVAPYSVKTDVPAPSPAAAEAAKKRSDAALAQAVEKVRTEAEAKFTQNPAAVHAAVAKVYDRYGRVEEAAAYRKANGLDGSDIWGRLAKDPTLAKNKELLDKEIFQNMNPAATNVWRYQIHNKYYANLPKIFSAERPEAFIAGYEYLLGVGKKYSAVVPAMTAKSAVGAYLKLKNPKAASAAAREGLRAAQEGLKDEKGSPADRYFFGLVLALENVRGDDRRYFAAVKKYDQTVTDIAGKDRVEGLCAYGSMMMELTGEEAMIRGLDAFRKSLYKPEPKKRYVVRYSETPITGLADWDKVTAEKQVYDRRYGGNMDFLETDVTTGTRAVGNSGEELARPTMEVVADVQGVHVLVRFPDPKAREIELGLVGNCSFEGYIAPGKNTPYICFIYTPADGKVSLFNTTYPTIGERRLEQSDLGDKAIFKTGYADGEVRHYIFFS